MATDDIYPVASNGKALLDREDECSIKKETKKAEAERFGLYYRKLWSLT